MDLDDLLLRTTSLHYARAPDEVILFASTATGK